MVTLSLPQNLCKILFDTKSKKNVRKAVNLKESDRECSDTNITYMNVFVKSTEELI